MSHTVHALDYLDQPEKHAPAAVCVLFGDEPFLKSQVQRELRRAVLGEDDVPFATFEGEQAQMRDLLDELSTVALFGGGGKRLVVVEEADKFVTLNREDLQKYVARPKANGVLLLTVDSWPANTKLFKAVNASGLAIECRVPEKKAKVPDEGRLVKWLTVRARQEHEVTLPADAARLLLELVGPEFGLLDQELAKLALFAGVGGKITPDLVRDVAGGWRVKSAWDLADAAAEGNAAEALAQLDRILQSGEKPVALFGQLAWSLRRFGVATRMFQEAERRGRKLSLAEALKAAGFEHWRPGRMEEAERQLIQLGRDRAGNLFQWLLELDLAFKGTHSPDHRGRWALEHLILRMARELAPKRQPSQRR
jgi:DNA polymerase-3 subunit delta